MQRYGKFNAFNTVSKRERTTDVLRKRNGCFILIATVTSRTYMYNITQPAKEKKNPYKSRDHFLSDREYGRYVKTVLQPGMKVRARETYESVSMRLWGISTDERRHTPCPGHVGGASGRLLGVLASGGLTALGGREENS